MKNHVPHLRMRNLLLMLAWLIGCAASNQDGAFDVRGLAADEATFAASDEVSVDQNLADAEASSEGCVARGADSEPAPAEVERIQNLLDVARTSFPELDGFNIRLRWTTSATDFVRTGFSGWSPFRSAQNREYRVIVSRNFLTDAPPDQAVVAVLTHELFHIADYTEMSGAELVGLAIRYLASPRSFVPRYETATDGRAVERGQACGLRDFRSWQHSHLRAEDLAVKERNYLDLAELEVLCSP